MSDAIFARVCPQCSGFVCNSVSEKVEGGDAISLGRETDELMTPIIRRRRKVVKNNIVNFQSLGEIYMSEYVVPEANVIVFAWSGNVMEAMISRDNSSNLSAQAGL